MYDFESDNIIGFAALYFNEQRLFTMKMIHPDFRNKGYGSEVTHGLLQLGFRILNAQTIYAEVNQLNTGNVSIVDKIYGSSSENKDMCQDNQKYFCYQITQEEYEKKCKLSD